MVLDVTKLALEDLFRSFVKQEKRPECFEDWLALNVGPIRETPNFKFEFTGMNPGIKQCGEGWVLVHQYIMVKSPPPDHQHNISAMRHWTPEVSASQYVLHFERDADAVQFKLRWL